LELQRSNYNFFVFHLLIYIGPKNLNAKTNKNGKSIVGDEEEELFTEDEDDLSYVDLGEEED